MSKASADTVTQPPVLSEKQDTISLLNSLDFRRRTGSILSSDELSQIEKLMKAFIDSPATRTAPSKQQLTAAVNALLTRNASLVSSKFNKCHLAGALHRWAQEAALLDPPFKQAKLFIEMRFIRGSRKHVDLSKAIYTEEDDGSVAALSICSPGPLHHEDEAPPPSQPMDDFLQSIPDTPNPAGLTPLSIATSASSFARRIGTVASLPELAPIGNSDPGVNPENAPPPEVPAPKGVWPGVCLDFIFALSPSLYVPYGYSPTTGLSAPRLPAPTPAGQVDNNQPENAFRTPEKQLAQRNEKITKSQGLLLTSLFCYSFICQS